MIKNYFKIAFRNLVKNKGYSFINIMGLATGMGVAILIGLWIWDELSYNQYHKNYSTIAQVWQHNIYNGEKASQVSNPYLMGEEIRNSFGSDFMKTKYPADQPDEKESAWNSAKPYDWTKPFDGKTK